MSAPGPSEDLARLEDRLRHHVEVLAGLIGMRHDSRPSTLDAAVSHITRSFEEMKQAVQIESYPTPRVEAKNLVVEWPGTRWPEQIIILGAHYDTVESTPGADDNASAVAVMLETARLLRDQRFKRTIRFVAFANEEPPHFTTSTMGSRVYAEACRERGDRIAGMVCLEMVGYFSDAPGSQEYPEEVPSMLRRMLPDVGNFIAGVGDLRSAGMVHRFNRAFKRQASTRLISLPLPPKLAAGMWLSDHGPFWDNGYKALMLTDTSWFRNPNYHMPTDTPDTLDYAAMVDLTCGVSAGVAALAGGRFSVASSSGARIVR